MYTNVSRGWAVAFIYTNGSRGRALDFVYKDISRGRALDLIYTNFRGLSSEKRIKKAIVHFQKWENTFSW